MLDEMLTRSALERLATQLDSLSLLLCGASVEAVGQRPASGKWSAHENLAHLARYHEVFLARLRRMLAEDKPRLRRYRAEEDPEWPQWAALSTEDVLRRLRALRAELNEAVRHLSPDHLSRTGVHSSFGEMAIPLWIEFFLLHEAHHLYVVMQRLRGS